MKKKKTILRVLQTLVFTPLLMVSCIGDPEPPMLDALPDVFIQKISESGEEKYALAFWVFGNKELESVTVEGPEGYSLNLEKDNINPQIFNSFPEMGDYIPEFPKSGTYEFTIKSTQEGEPPFKVSDVLEDKEIVVVSIDSIKFESSQVQVFWETAAGADNYRVRLYNDSEEIIFLSPQLADNKKEYAFSITDDGWAGTDKMPETGDNCRLEVLAILYETGATTNKDYNIQCITIAMEDIEWQF